MHLQQTTAIITGATRGIGLAIAHAMAREGATLVLGGKNRERVQAVEALFQKEYSQSHRGCVMDVSDNDTLAPTVKALLKEHTIDCLINAAGVCHDQLLIRATQHEMESTLNTNLLGTMRMCQYVTKAMLRRRAGCIINLSSVVGIEGNSGQTVYSASKAGIVGLTRSLAKEVGPSGIRVNCIAPGYIATDMTAALLSDEKKTAALLQSIPLRRVGTVEEVAHAAMFLLQADYVHGQTLRVDGGMIL
ncbi:3-ketoacyl-reductase [Spinellus fusiger]|nr:3-ketoacyl-reductase [Spinellus fusiger]KAI7869218.1 3-ketoacyl-reductase [Spinellus fusiger]